ncbi:MFS transporter [Nakamurella leprariae]|uniref:MFS transporter n=1 Tax=Nakamurella leprariae TaxID=2803911 RepID=A0A938YBQ4_9ACTN|nr:MFS transporter [Nakamurella leprariae]MBM9466708.1 MFS transporter [Nakamurella leprariae]
MALTDRQRRTALAACLAAGFATLVDQGLLGIVTPALQRSLAADTAQTQWILSGYSLTFGLALVPAGRLGDRFGRRRLFLTGVALFSLTSLVSGLAVDPWLVIVARLVQGAGAGMLSAQVLGVIQDLFAGTARARALGAYGVAAGLSGLVGPIGGAALVTASDDSGWRLALLANLPFALVAFVLGLLALPRPRLRADAGAAAVSVDPVGLTGLAAATVLLLLPMVWAGASVPLLLGGAAVALMLFVGWERWYARHGRTPVLLPDLGRAPGYVRGVTVATFWFGAGVGHGTVLSLYLISGLGFSPIVAALVALPRSVTFVITSAVSWRLAVRFGHAVVSVGVAGQLLGAAVIGLAALWFAPSSFLWTVVAVELLMGVAHGLSEAPNRTFTLQSVPSHSAGLAAGFLQLSQRLSATLVVAGAVGILLGGAGGPTFGTDGFVVASALVVGLLAASLVASILLGRGQRTSLERGDGAVVTAAAPRPESPSPGADVAPDAIR